MSNLRLCPFCGKYPQTVVDDETEEKFGVKCFNCGGSIYPEKETLREAIEAWNRRASIEPERKTGRWVEKGNVHFCPECGWALMDTPGGEPPYMGIDYNRVNPERPTVCPGWVEEFMNYCPNCGADMRQ